ncbi:peptide ABC transporter substrate-binding protein [Brachyspira hampsonii]|uniref:peptide ABC transporter substrate-binding protein n=1 Tax=Brachyspira hampsonii TaxID=1287055 RepID=UPI000D3B29CF|nr:peptide ABC transporter substrate-binding protein [Brachyspira hampsonii]PTY40614.1 ABC transporter substrate-binding protein [Brachyspira hampsonii bv. II]
MKKNILIKLFCLLYVIFILSCHKEPKNILNEITVSVGPEPQTIDPTINSAVDAMIYTTHLFENLTIRDENNNIIPGAAESWTSSNNNTIYIFNIRSNAKWSDGVDLKANDFVYAWKRIVDPKNGASYSILLDVIKNAGDIMMGKKDKETLGVKALDDKTLYVELEYPVPYFVEMVAHTAYTPLREDIVSQNEDGWTLDVNTMVGNGAFQIVRWDHNARLVVRKNTDYWNYKEIKPDIINFEFIDNDNTAMSAIINEEIYFYHNTPINDREMLLKEGIARAVPNISLYFYEVDNRKKPFNDARVRKAISLAIDREYIVNNIMKGGEKPAAAIVPYNIKDVDSTNDFRYKKEGYFSTKSEDYQKNVEEARALLADAGYPNGENFPVFEFITNPGFHITIAESIQAMLKEALNINMVIRQEEWAVLLQTRRDGNFDMARQGWIGGYNSPAAFLSLVKTGYVLNEGRYSNPLFDKALLDASTAENDSDRSMYFHEAESIAMNDMAIIPIYYYSGTVMQNAKLTNVIYDIFGIYNFSKAEIVEESN